MAHVAPSAGAAPLSYGYDPAHPVPAIGGALTSLEPVASGGAWDQVESPACFGCQPPYLPLSSRADVLAPARGFPLSLRLIKEIRAVLLAKGRGEEKDPGEFRRSQNRIGGTRPGTALFVPPPRTWCRRGLAIWKPSSTPNRRTCHCW